MGGTVHSIKSKDPGNERISNGTYESLSEGGYGYMKDFDKIGRGVYVFSKFGTKISSRKNNIF